MRSNLFAHFRQDAPASIVLFFVASPLCPDIALGTGFLDLFTRHDWAELRNPARYMTAATLAVVASIETLLCAEATHRLDPRKRLTPADGELVAQGGGNIVSGLLGGPPIMQVIVRTSAHIQAGAQSRLWAVLHGVLLLVCLATLPRVLSLIQLAVLAGMLLIVG